MTRPLGGGAGEWARRGLSFGLPAGVLTGCTPGGETFLDPAGPVASAQRELFIWVLGLSLVVVIPVVLLTPWLLWRYRYRSTTSAYRPQWDFSLPVDCITWGVPFVVVAVLAVITWRATFELDPYRPLPSTQPTLQVQVIGLDWQWLFIYPEQGVASLNQLVIPSGQAVHLTLTSASVMQSLLIGRLSGQIYAMAGMRTQQYLQAREQGEFSGRNTQFNGIGFQHQRFSVQSVSPAAFEQWLGQAQQAPDVLDCEGFRLFSRPGIATRPRLFRHVAPGLFDAVVAGAIKPGNQPCVTTSERGQHD